MITVFIDGKRVKVDERQLKAAEQCGMLIERVVPVIYEDRKLDQIKQYQTAPQHRDKIHQITIRAWQEHKEEIVLPVDPVAPEPRVTESPDWCVRAAMRICKELSLPYSDKKDLAGIIREEFARNVRDALAEVERMPVQETSSDPMLSWPTISKLAANQLSLGELPIWDCILELARYIRKREGFTDGL